MPLVGRQLPPLAGLAHQTAPRAIITDAGLMPLAADAGITGLPPLGVLDAEELTKGWDSLAAPAAGPPPVPPVGHADIAVLIPTSGTTGRSKLVMQTHRAYAMAGEGFPYWMELTAADRMMTSLPLFHINAPAYSVMGSLACGAGLILLPRFSASTFLDSARRHGATEFNAIGAMLEILMRQEPRPGDADTPLRHGQTLHQLIPNSRLFVFHNVGHLPQEERPREFTEMVAEFCQTGAIDDSR